MLINCVKCGSNHINLYLYKVDYEPTYNYRECGCQDTTVEEVSIAIKCTNCKSTEIRDITKY